MALVKHLAKITKQRNVVHEPVECSYTIFEAEGARYVQLDTFGSSTRKLKHKVSQALQFDRESAGELRAILDRAFPEP